MKQAIYTHFRLQQFSFALAHVQKNMNMPIHPQACIRF